MDNQEVEKTYSTPEESGQLSRNRSFKSKQLVRSQAIRESTSPPRTVSPNPPKTNSVTAKNSIVTVKNNVTTVSDSERTLDNSSDTSSQLCSDNCASVSDRPVEIQITGGAWEEDVVEPTSPVRWSQHSQCSGHLLSNSPQRACVCERANNSGGGRRKSLCPTKQDSGIVCPDDCADLSDNEGGSACDLRKSGCEVTPEDAPFCSCAERKEKPKSTLSRADSDDRTDLSGAELVNFIKATLNKNMRDRATLLKIEKELHSLVNDTGRCIVRFPVMTSYGRMLVHRCAALFQLSHHLDAYNKACVIVSKSGTSGGRIPCTRFKTWCAQSLSTQSPLDTARDTLHKSILKRDAHSLDDSSNNGGASAVRSKSLEQREKDYERVRRRIFSNDNCSQDESQTQWPWLSGPVKLLTPDTGRNKLLKVQSLESASGSSGPQSWRSKGAVSKSHSFGGYGGDEQQQPSTNRVLSRQGDLASSSWRLSPSSSGYKTLSLRSTDSVTPSPTGGVSPEPSVQTSQVSTGQLLWAVTDLSRVPHGALIIHPQTGQPLTNPDGTIYRYDPANPPAVYDPPADRTEVDQSNDKRRGRLEKQHSFIDNECECPPPEECRTKGCCCECRRAETHCQDPDCDKINPPQEPAQIPTSPLKAATYAEPTKHSEPTNHAPPFEAPTNHRPPPTDVTNQRANKNEESGYSVQQGYVQYRADEEVQTSPPHQPTNPGYVHPDVQVTSKSTPVPQHDNNIRPVSLTGVVYPTGIPSGYTYTNQCRIEPSLPPPIYQPVAPPGGDEPKMQPDHEPTFRIDASYPYAPVEPYAGYAQQCGGACAIDPAALHHRGFGVTYTPGIEPTMVAGYPMNNVILQQPIQQYPVSPYQQIQWQGIQPIIATQTIPSNCGTPLQKPTSPPNIYLPQPDLPLTYHTQSTYNQNQPVYPMLQYHNYPYHQTCVLPQVLPQTYYQPIYPMMEQNINTRRNSINRRSISNSSRNTPLDGATPPVEERKVPYEDNNRKFVKQSSFQEEKRRTFVRTSSVKSDIGLSRQNSSELAMKIQQIKDQMAALNTQDKGDPRVYTRNDRKPEEFKGRRNNGNGILGSYPANNGSFNNHNRVMGRPPVNDESQLSSAARAIVNSIRSMQSKSNNLQHDTRRDYHGQQNYQHHRPEHRNEYQHRNRHQKPQDETKKPEFESQGEAQPAMDGVDRGVDQSEKSSQVNRPMERPERPQVDPAAYNRRPVHAGPPVQYRPHYVYRQMTPGTWCRRSPGPLPPNMNTPRRPPHPDSRSHRRQ